MSIYVITNSEIHDPAAYEKYKAAAPEYVARHGGEYCVRGGAFEVLGRLAAHPPFGFEISHARGLCEFHGRPWITNLGKS